ncbi:unnamed protein product [Didymodactylos carnosus]|uniref:F-box domain-containing protein n=1 Tax=Didymodactylos carnosus TaxID=1234261 RepID=A0A8S2F4V3_9BILA|nr:unnamed protein product [Didymodactylos carnosus]CAF4134666.1 unnamed protein product [Didymodactylos carnosus]
MPTTLEQFPNELFHCVFDKLKLSDVLYTFYELNERFRLLTESLAQRTNKFNLTDVPPRLLVIYLSSVGHHIHQLKLSSDYFYLNLLPNLYSLTIVCHDVDVRSYLVTLSHRNVSTLTVTFNQQTIPNTLLIKCQSSIYLFSFKHLTLQLRTHEQCQEIQIYDKSEHIEPGLYYVQCVFSQKYLTYVKDHKPTQIFQQPLVIGKRKIDILFVLLLFYYYVISRSDRVLTIEKTSRFSPQYYMPGIILDEFMNTKQLFNFEKVTDDGEYMIVFKFNTNYVLDIYNNDMRLDAARDNQRLQPHLRHGGRNQRFKFIPIPIPEKRFIDEHKLKHIKSQLSNLFSRNKTPLK